MNVPVGDEKRIKIANANRANPYVDITPYELGITFPFVSYIGFHPMIGEILLYAAPAATFKDKEKVVGYTGNSTGISVRVAKGISVRTGGSGSRAIRDVVHQSNMGDLLITNKRVMFIGKDDSFEFQIGKISTVKLLDSNSFIIQSGRSFKNIWLDTAIAAYAYGFIDYAINENSQGIDLYAAVKEEQSKVKSEQIELCKQVRDECAHIKEPKIKNKQGCLWRVAIFLWILLALVMVGGIILVSVLNNSDDIEAKFEIANSMNLNEEVFVEENGTITFYAYPTSIDNEDIELINSDDSKAYCLIQDVRSVNGKRLIIVSYKGLAVGESIIYIKEKDRDTKSESVHISVKEKQVEIDNSRTVYLNYSGDKYHYSEACAGRSAYKSTLNQVNKYNAPCSKCVN